ncbi:MAG: CHAT domain-containing protein, partial [Smithellaceae bacterium]
ISSRVITQLWEVPDATRAAFMKFYYNCLKKSGDTAYSLRTAQNEMIQEGYGPSDWAAFIVTGRY